MYMIRIDIDAMMEDEHIFMYTCVCERRWEGRCVYLITYMNIHMDIPKKTTERTSGCAGDEPASAV